MTTHCPHCKTKINITSFQGMEIKHGKLIVCNKCKQEFTIYTRNGE